MKGVEVNQIVNEFKMNELKGRTDNEILEVFETYCQKQNPTVTDGIKIGYLYGWILVSSESMGYERNIHKCGCGGC